GRAFGIFLQPNSGGGYANRCDLGTITGTGNWEIFSKTLAQGSNLATFISFMNTHPAAGLEYVTGQATSLTSYQTGGTLLYDNINLYYESSLPDAEGWRPYEVRLSDGTQGPTGTRFIDFLNANNSISFVPT